MSPRFVSSTSEFNALVQIGTTPESATLEFKNEIESWPDPSRLPDKKRIEVQKEFCRDVAQFANTFGGCLLIGVDEKASNNSGLKVADSIKNVQKPDELKQWLEQAITKYLVPSTFDREIVPVQLGGDTIVAINVPASRHLVSIWDSANHTVEYLRRTDHGKAWMNPDEAERHIMNGSRAARLALIAAQKSSTSGEIEIAGGLWMRFQPGPSERDQPLDVTKITLGRTDDFTFEVQAFVSATTSHSIALPYGVIMEAWITTRGQIGLLLSVRVIFDSRRSKLMFER